MFVSWVSQNIYIYDLDVKIKQITTNAQFISTENGKALQWMLKYQEEIRKKPTYDPEVIANTAYGYASTMKQILEAAKQMNPQSTILMGHHKKITQYKEDIENAIKSEDVNTIIMISTELMQWSKKAFDEALPEFRAVEAKINSSNALWTKIFRYSYITASCLFGLFWLVVNGRSLLKPKISNNQKAAQVGPPKAVG